MQPTYDALSNVIETTTTLPQGVDTQVFCYDDLSRLVWAGSSGTPGCTGAPTPSDTGSLAGAGGAQYSASYAYDSMNRLTSAPLGSYSYGESAHADAATAIGAAWSASYDAAGNTTCRTATSATTCAGSAPTGAQLSWDNEGRLTAWQNLWQVTGSTPALEEALYDGEGNRVAQVTVSAATNATAQHTYVGGLEDLASQWPNAGGATTTTTTAYYGSLAESVNGALSYTLSDGLGSVSESVATSSGAVSATQLYGPYGAVRYQSGTLPTDQGFTGQRSDATSGLDYYGARYYDPVAGQFTSADTTLAGGLNRYGYVGGNPESATDPSGHLIVSQREYSQPEAMRQAQTQPATVYANQWAEPATWGGFVAYIGQSVLGTDTLSQSFHTLFQDPQASAGDKAKAAVVGLVTVASDLVTIGSTFVGEPEVGEGLHAADEALLAATDVSHVAGASTDLTTDLTTEVTDACAGGLSFSADTPVATPHGEQAIARLQVGQQVEAYDPTTGQTAPQTIVRIFLNHDNDRLDVTLATHAPVAASATAASPSQTGQAGHGRRAFGSATLTTTVSATAMTTATQAEVVHTTANHPWLSADHGWLVAGSLHLGEPVRLLDGATASVVALRALPGVGPMWDLSLDAIHTFAVGDVQAVVHNCPVGDSGGSSVGGEPRPTIKVGDLNPIHSPSTAGERPELQNLSDDELLQAVNNPVNNDPIRVNTRTGGVMDGNGRAYELQRRAADPNSIITPDTEVQYEPYVPFTPWDMG